MPGRGATLPAARLHVGDGLGDIRFLGRSAIEPFADFGAKGLELGLPQGLTPAGRARPAPGISPRPARSASCGVAVVHAHGRRHAARPAGAKSGQAGRDGKIKMATTNVVPLPRQQLSPLREQQAIMRKDTARWLASRSAAAMHLARDEGGRNQMARFPASCKTRRFGSFHRQAMQSTLEVADIFRYACEQRALERTRLRDLTCRR